MCQNLYLYERYVEEHLREMQRDMQRERMAADLSRQRPGVGRHMVSRLGKHLIALGTRLERVEGGATA
jgi:hypothetical protein